jgi:hypothetical protein
MDYGMWLAIGFCALVVIGAIFSLIPETAPVWLTLYDLWKRKRQKKG